MTFHPYYDDYYRRPNMTSYGMPICPHGIVHKCRVCEAERLEKIKKAQAEQQEKGGTV